MLSFDAYLEDEISDKRQEIFRIRYYKIYFYLEDDTIQVNEPEVINSGLPQGIYLKLQHDIFAFNSCLYILSVFSFVKDPMLILRHLSYRQQ